MGNKPSCEHSDHSQILKQLSDLAGKRQKVRLTRSIPSDTTHNGFLIAVQRELALLLQFHDFSPEGFTVLRVKDIEEVRSAKYERFWEHMLTSEAIMDQVRPPSFDVPLEDMPTLVRALHDKGDHVIVHCEDPVRPLENFLIGRIISIGEDSLEFANFDGLGRWDTTTDTVPFAEITQVEFDTPYIRTFSKYLEGPCPHR